MKDFSRIKILLFIAITSIQHVNSVPSAGKVETLFSWQPFVYADLPHSEYAQVDGNDYYISKNVLPTAVSYHDKTGCLILPIQRLHPGIPGTINFINVLDYKKGSSPPLKALPTYVDNYVPGWFGVNDLREDDYKYNIYPSDYKVKRQTEDEVEGQEKNPIVEEDKNANEGEIKDKENVQENSNQTNTDKKDEEKTAQENQDQVDEDDETRKKHGSHYKPTYSQGHHGGSYVVHLPAKTTTAAPAPTKPTYNPPSPPKNPTRDVYHFISVYFTDTDSDCDRLTFVDHGSLLYPNNVIFIRRPIIWAFDIYECSEEGFGHPPALKVTIPDSVVSQPEGFCAFVVDNYASCNQFAVYIANCFDNRIVVYDNVKRSFWYFEHETFKPGAERSLYPGPLPPQDSYNFGIMNIGGGEDLGNSYKTIYYSPGSSYGLFKTSSKILRNKSLAPGNPTSPKFSFIGYGGIDNQEISSFDSDTQVLFFIHLLSNKLQCWNINTPLVQGNVVTLFSDLEFGVDMLINDDRYLQFILYYGHGVPYWELEIPSDAYYNLYSVSVDAIIKGTACDPKNV